MIGPWPAWASKSPGVARCSAAAAVGRHQSHDDIEAGRLAGAIRPQQSHHLPAADAQINSANHLPPFVCLADSLGYQCFHLVLSALSPFHLGAVVSVVVLRPPPSTLTLSSPPSKIKASPVALPRTGSLILGGTEAVPVSTYSPVSPV